MSTSEKGIEYGSDKTADKQKALRESGSHDDCCRLPHLAEFDNSHRFRELHHSRNSRSETFN